MSSRTSGVIAEHLGAPVATTLQGLAAFPADHPLHTGMGFGPSAVPAAQNAFKNCDAMLAVGTRFAEISTGSFGAIPRRTSFISTSTRALWAGITRLRCLIHADARDAVPALAATWLSPARHATGAAQAESIASDKTAWLESGLLTIQAGGLIPASFSALCVNNSTETQSLLPMTATTRS